MSRPWTPTNILELRGSFAKDPQQRRKDPPTSGPVGPAPRRAKLSFKQAWGYIVECAPAGILRDRDRVTLEITAILFASFRNDPEAMTASKLTQLTTLLARLGMTPSDASRVPAPASDEPNEFADD